MNRIIPEWQVGTDLYVKLFCCACVPERCKVEQNSAISFFLPKVDVVFGNIAKVEQDHRRRLVRGRFEVLCSPRKNECSTRHLDDLIAFAKNVRQLLINVAGKSKTYNIPAKVEFLSCSHYGLLNLSFRIAEPFLTQPFHY